MKTRFSEEEMAKIHRLCEKLLLAQELFAYPQYQALRIRMNDFMPSDMSFKELVAQIQKINGIKDINSDKNYQELYYLLTLLTGIHQTPFHIDRIEPVKGKKITTDIIGRNNTPYSIDIKLVSGKKFFTLDSTSELGNFPILVSLGQAIKESLASLNDLLLTEEEKIEKERKADEALEKLTQKKKNEKERIAREEAQKKEATQKALENIEQKETVDSFNKDLQILFLGKENEKIDGKIEEVIAVKNRAEDIVKKYSRTDYEPKSIEDIQKNIAKLDEYHNLLMQYQLHSTQKHASLSKASLEEKIGILNQIYPWYEKSKKLSLEFSGAFIYQKEVEKICKEIENDLSRLEAEISENLKILEKFHEKKYIRPVVYLGSEDNSAALDQTGNLSDFHQSLTTFARANTSLTQIFNRIESIPYSSFTEVFQKKIHHITEMKDTMNKSIEEYDELLKIKNDIEEHASIEKQLNTLLNELEKKITEHKAVIDPNENKIKLNHINNCVTENDLKNLLKTEENSRRITRDFLVKNQDIIGDIEILKKEIAKIKNYKYNSGTPIKLSKSFDSKLNELESSLNNLEGKCTKNVEEITDQLMNHGKFTGEIAKKIDTADSENIKKSLFFNVNGKDFEYIKSVIQRNKNYIELINHKKNTSKGKCEAINDLKYGIEHSKNLQDIINLIISPKNITDHFTKKTEEKTENIVISQLDERLRKNTAKIGFYHLSGYASTTDKLLTLLKKDLCEFIHNNYDTTLENTTPSKKSAKRGK